MRQEEIRVDVEGHPMRAILTLPEKEGPTPGLVIVFEILGLNDEMKRVARDFAAKGYASILPDLFDRPDPKPLCVAKTLLDQRLGRGRSFTAIENARRALASRPEVDGERLGIVGFCLGGGFAIAVGARGGYKVAAPFYGMMPTDTESVRSLCPTVASYGARDTLFVSQGEKLRRHLEQYRIPHDYKLYEGAGHSFMTHMPAVFEIFDPIHPLHPGFHGPSEKDAWERMLSFFRTHLDATDAPSA